MIALKVALPLAAAATTLVLLQGPPPQDAALSRREFEARMAELDKRLSQRFELSDRAIDAALTAMNARLTGMNEFRASLKDQTGTFLTRVEWEARTAAVDDRLRLLEAANQRAEGRSQQNTILIGVVGFVILVITFGVRFLDRQKTGTVPP